LEPLFSLAFSGFSSLGGPPPTNEYEKILRRLHGITTRRDLDLENIAAEATMRQWRTGVSPSYRDLRRAVLETVARRERRWLPRGGTPTELPPEDLLAVREALSSLSPFEQGQVLSWLSNGADRPLSVFKKLRDLLKDFPL